MENCAGPVEGPVTDRDDVSLHAVTISVVQQSVTSVFAALTEPRVLGTSNVEPLELQNPEPRTSEPQNPSPGT
jgi:hypothetical protein